MMDDIRFFVGIDWASEKHRVCLLDATGQRLGEREVAHGGGGLAELCTWLLERTGVSPGQIAIAIEMPRGPIVETLLERGFQVYVINPKQLDRFRDRFTIAGAKDDSRDAQTAADALRTDRHVLRRLAIDDPVLIELREWSRMHEDLQQDRTAHANQVREQLWRYYPQAIELTDDFAADWFLAVWSKASTPAKAARVSESTIAGVLKAHRIRRLDAAAVLRILRQKALWVAPGTAEAATARIRQLSERIQLINRQIKEVERQLDQLCDTLAAAQESQPGQSAQRDVAILRSFPGLGRIILATLLAEGSDLLQRRDYQALRALSGQAPVTHRSGKSCVVIRRYACNKRLREALYHWARGAIQHDPISQQRYAELRRRGHSHGRALRTVGDRLLMVACTLLERQQLFDPDHRAVQLAAA